MVMTRRLSIYVAVLAILVAYLLIWPVWRAQFLIEIWPTEAWNAYFQDTAAAGGLLYPPADQLVGNNYPPLSFYVIGYLGQLFGNNLFVGRAVSIVALLCISVEIFLAVRILAGGITGAAIGALWYAAITAHSSELYVGTNDPQLAGEAVMGAGLVWFLARNRDGKSALAPLLLMVVAGFWKHNIVAIPLTSVAWLLLRDGKRGDTAGAAQRRYRSRRAVALHRDLRPRLSRQFVRDPRIFTSPCHRSYRPSAMVRGRVPDLGVLGLERADFTAARFTVLHVAIGLSTCLLQWFGHGVGRNAEFDLVIALGIGVGVAFERIDTSLLAQRIGVGPSRDLLLVLLVLRLVVSDRQGSALVLFSPEFRASVHAAERAALDDVKRVADIRGDVFCSNKVVCRAAGKPFAVDEFKMEELVATGRR